MGVVKDGTELILSSFIEGSQQQRSKEMNGKRGRGQGDNYDEVDCNLLLAKT